MKIKDSMYIIFAIFIIDQIAKFIFKNLLADGEIRILGDFFKLNLAYNTGAAFSIFTGKNILLVFAMIIVIALLAYYLKKNEDERMPMSLIIGGALGNLFDRIFFGSVVDFIDIWIWPVFNIADTAITMGVLIMIIDLIKKKS